MQYIYNFAMNHPFIFTFLVIWLGTCFAAWKPVTLYKNPEERDKAAAAAKKFLGEVKGMAELKVSLDEGISQQLNELVQRAVLEGIGQAMSKTVMQKDYLSLTEAQEYLGIAYGTLQKWIREMGLPISVIGGKSYISRKNIHDFMKKHEI